MNKCFLKLMRKLGFITLKEHASQLAQLLRKEDEITQEDTTKGKPEDLFYKGHKIDIGPIEEEKIARTIKERIGLDITLDQRKMIFSKSQNTYVIAGAGSGKSTSLILRILFLTEYVGIPLNQITVFTFTRESKDDFKKNMRLFYEKFDRPLSQASVDEVVKTFHSKMWSFGSTAGLISGRKKLFEFIGKSQKQIEDSGTDDVLNLNMRSTRPENNEQRSVLRDAYRDAFNKNSYFKTLISEMVRISFHKGFYVRGGDDYEKHLNDVANADKSISTHLQGLFNSTMLNLKLESFSPDRFETSLQFYVNGYIPEVKCYLVFIPEDGLLNNLKKEHSGLGYHLWVKERFITDHSKEKVIFIRCQQDLDRVVALLDWHKDPKGKEPNPDIFRYRLEGEISAQPIHMAFFSAGQFIENMGIEVEQISSYVDGSSLELDEKLFVKALIIYWQYFEEQLIDKGQTRFHKVFSYFSEDKLYNYGIIRDLSSMKHIMIDEFQDISPEIVKWIRGVLKTHKERECPASLMCVGDDWQSIYGWRGSTPSFLLDYRSKFCCSDTLEVTLAENYRCYQDLIDSAETIILKGVKEKSTKKGRSQREKKNGDKTIIKIETEDASIIKKKIEEILIEAEAMLKAEDNKTVLLIMTRTRKQQDPYLEYKNRSKIKVLTYHQSKGLQAAYCILIGECFSQGRASFKNLIYEIAGYKQTYDDAQLDEAMRLAYVALTRAKEKSFWFVKPKTAGASRLLPGLLVPQCEKGSTLSVASDK